MARNVTVKCLVCGCEVKSERASRRYCESCTGLVGAARARFRRLGAEYTDEDCVEVAKGKLARNLAPSGDRQQFRCLYCGNLTTSATRYCTTCRHEGYDDIHRITGRTNGWDAETHERPHVETEWRGQRAMGGGAASWFPGRMDWLGR